MKIRDRAHNLSTEGRLCIRFYPLTDMRSTPFGRPEIGIFESCGREVLKDHGIILTDNPQACDFFVAHRYPLGRRFLYKFKLRHGLSKPILVWTNEPRHCTVSENSLKRTWLLPPIHIMSVYTRDVYLTNFSFWSFVIKSPLPLMDERTCPALSRKRIAAVLSHVAELQKRSLVKDGRQLDLTRLRQRLVLDGHRRGMVDIYGRGWPEGLSKGASSTQRGRHRWKLQILKDYHFNVCLENTNFDYYCTEKIWEAIKGGCLPIYYGKNNRIYEDFPMNSFIDVAEFANSDKLYDYIETMDTREYCDRMNKCIGTYNRFLSNDSFKAQFDRVVVNTAEQIKTIVSA